VVESCHVQYSFLMVKCRYLSPVVTFIGLSVLQECARRVLIDNCGRGTEMEDGSYHPRHSVTSSLLLRLIPSHLSS
jgi:hypothetical protein